LRDIQYVSDEIGNTMSVIVPIELWHEIESEKNCVFAEKRKNESKAFGSKDRNEGISLEQAREKLGI
jgi:hypothetical protein